MLGRILIKTKKNFVINGHVSGGFEPVEREFYKLFERGFDTNSQLCVYVGNERVLDLYGKPADCPFDYVYD